MTKLVRERWEDVDTLEEAVDKLLSEEWALLYGAQVGFLICTRRCQAIDGEYGCQLISSGKTVFSGNLVMIWQKDWPYAPLLDY